jgi:hypothetical protein
MAKALVVLSVAALAGFMAWALRDRRVRAAGRLTTKVWRDQVDMLTNANFTLQALIRDLERDAGKQTALIQTLFGWYRDVKAENERLKGAAGDGLDLVLQAQGVARGTVQAEVEKWKRALGEVWDALAELVSRGLLPPVEGKPVGEAVRLLGQELESYRELASQAVPRRRKPRAMKAPREGVEELHGRQVGVTTWHFPPAAPGVEPCLDKATVPGKQEYICTRPKGHGGPVHVAHSSANLAIARWVNATPEGGR